MRATKKRDKSSTGMRYTGAVRFKRVLSEPELEKESPTEEHAKALLADLPYIRLALSLMTKNDRELEKPLRSADPDSIAEMRGFHERLGAIVKRYRGTIETCEAAQARVLIVLDRLINGPNPAPWAGGREVAP